MRRLALYLVLPTLATLLCCANPTNPGPPQPPTVYRWQLTPSNGGVIYEWDTELETLYVDRQAIDSNLIFCLYCITPPDSSSFNEFPDQQASMQAQIGILGLSYYHPGVALPGSTWCHRVEVHGISPGFYYTYRRRAGAPIDTLRLKAVSTSYSDTLGYWQISYHLTYTKGGDGT